MARDIYKQWLKASGRTKEGILALLKFQIAGQDSDAFDLLEETGDTKYTAETFDKAADIILNYKNQ